MTHAHGEIQGFGWLLFGAGEGLYRLADWTSSHALAVLSGLALLTGIVCQIGGLLVNLRNSEARRASDRARWHRLWRNSAHYTPAPVADLD